MKRFWGYLSHLWCRFVCTPYWDHNEQASFANWRSRICAGLFNKSL